MNTFVWTVPAEHDWICQGQTKAGNRCRNRTSDRFSPTCHNHATPEVADMAALLAKVYDAGVASGRESAESHHRMQREWEERQAQRAAEAAANYRTHTTSGHQIVQAQAASGRGKILTYEWSGDIDLAVGDHVWVPASWAFAAHVATITELGSSYTDTLVTVSRRATDAETARYGNAAFAG